MDFDAIRKHVNRRGSRLYCDPRADTQDHEHLMIVYYDVMLIDDESLLGTSHEDRFHRLAELVACRPGYAELVQREVIDFRSHTAPAQLRRAFARCITAHLEGLVLKPLKDPYFDLKGGPGSGTTSSTTLEWPYLASYVIKLKKGYIGGFGEVGDFAVVGGRYDAAKAREYPPDLPGLRWTHFFIGCLDTPKPGQTQSRSRPRFVVTNVVTLTVAQMTSFLRHCRPHVVPYEKRSGKKTRHSPRKPKPEEDIAAPFDLAPLEPGLDDSKGGPTELFADPPVVDIRCFSFHRQGYGRFWSPRFPSVVKFHFDRTYADALGFADLQAMAVEAEARTTVYDDDFFDGVDDGDTGGGGGVDDPGHAHWVAQLKRADPRGIAMDAETSQSQSQSQSPSQTTARSQSTSASTTQGRSQSAMRQLGGSAGGLGVKSTPYPLIEIHEEEDEGHDKHSQLSIVTVKTYKTYKDEKDGKDETRTKPAGVVTVIDLTGDDSQETSKMEEVDASGEGEVVVNEVVVEPQQEAKITTPKQRAASLPLLRRSPFSATTPTTPKATPQHDASSSSPLPPASCSPIDFVSSLTAPSTTTTDGSQDRPASQDSLESDAQGHRPQSPRSLPGDSPSRKRRRLRAWDAASLYPAVSPPQLKRARSGI